MDVDVERRQGKRESKSICLTRRDHLLQTKCMPRKIKLLGRSLSTQTELMQIANSITIILVVGTVSHFGFQTKL